jgi:hypothetical protein
LLADGWGLVGAAALLYAVYAIGNAIAQVAIQRSALAVRGALMQGLYRKSLNIRVDAAVEMGAAKASNLMSVDVDNIVRELGAVHDVWTALVLTGLGLYIIYTQIGISFVSTIENPGCSLKRNSSQVLSVPLYSLPCFLLLLDESALLEVHGQTLQTSESNLLHRFYVI